MASGGMTAVVLLMPWFVGHGAQIPPWRALAAALLAGAGAGLLIAIVTTVFGVAHLRLATCCVLVVLMLFLYGTGPFFGIPGVSQTKNVITLLDDTYSARPIAEKLETVAPREETVAVFRVKRETEYGLSFYRRHEVINYDESGVPPEQHLLVARVTGRGGADLQTQAALQQYLAGRHYEQLFTWPEQGLAVYLVGAL